MNLKLNRWARKPGKTVPLVAETSQDVPFAAGSVLQSPTLRNFYKPVLLTPDTLGGLATHPRTIRQVLDTLRTLEPDDYVRYLIEYLRTGLDRYGEAWRYADLTTVLCAASELVSPEQYLEIGVRRGRSLAVLSSRCPTCALFGFDIWQSNYANMENPGPEFVLSELARVGHTGTAELISGDSHATVPAYLAEHPDLFFDIITVDGDHSEKGAEQDLRNVLPRLKIGGIIIFDDICSPYHPELQAVWRRVVASNPRYRCWEYTALGFGTAFGIRYLA